MKVSNHDCSEDWLVCVRKTTKQKMNAQGIETTGSHM